MELNELFDHIEALEANLANSRARNGAKTTENNNLLAENKELKEKLEVSNATPLDIMLTEEIHALRTKLLDYEVFESNKVAEFSGEYVGTYYGLEMYAVKEIYDDNIYIPNAKYPFKIKLSKETK